MSNSMIVTWFLALFLACPFISQVVETPMPDGPTESGSPVVIGNELAIEGVLVEHINDCIFDGNCSVVIETADGGQYNVIYAPGMLMCPNPNLPADISEWAVGDQVEAYGEVLGDGSILVCNSETYYLNRLAE